MVLMVGLCITMYRSVRTFTWQRHFGTGSEKEFSFLSGRERKVTTTSINRGDDRPRVSAAVYAIPKGNERPFSEETIVIGSEN